MTTYTDPSNFKPGNPGTGMAHILMPRHESHQGAMIAPRSGIVMRPAPNDASYGVLHYEGNLHGAMNLNKWQERVMCAAGRLFTNYPTIAKSMLPADQVKNEFENIGDLRWFGSPNTPYLMHLDLECLDALTKMTGEEKHAHVHGRWSAKRKTRCACWPLAATRSPRTTASSATPSSMAIRALLIN